MIKDDEGFLKRWSRLKRSGGDVSDKLPDEAPELPGLDTLGPDSDFSAFMHPKVDPLLRRAALATLFRSPQYQAMDGLDVYIDDYSNPEVLAPAVAAGLRHARALLNRDDSDSDADANGEAPAASGASPLPAQHAASEHESSAQAAIAGDAAASPEDSVGIDEETAQRRIGDEG